MPFRERQVFFEEAERVLRPGGRIAGEDWLAKDLADEKKRNDYIEPVCKSWAIPMLGDANEYLYLMESANLENPSVVDMQTLLPLHRGFAVERQDLDELHQDILHCENPLLSLTLKGPLRLGEAVRAGAFTIGRISARKPER